MTSPFFNFEDLPPHVQEHIKKTHDMHHMQHVTALHAINNLFDELNRDQLQTLRMLVESATGSSDSGNHYLGRITQVLQAKHDVCSCGENHDEEHMDLTKALYTEEGERVTGTVTVTDDATGAETVSPFGQPITFPVVDGEMKGEVPIQQDHTAAEEAAARAERGFAMDAYNVFDVPASGGRVVCREEGCGQQWQSLEDRKLGNAGKGGCPKCAQKEAWG